MPRVKQINHADIQCPVSWNATKILEIFLAKWNVLMNISHLKYTPDFFISSFLAASQRGIVFESETENIFISCP